ncbi:6_t:CDS:1, partial [Entrophospora sp. SA101]
STSQASCVTYRQAYPLGQSKFTFINTAPAKTLNVNSLDQISSWK